MALVPDRLKPVAQILRYALVAVLSLAVDCVVFFALVGGVRPMLAGVAGYAAGMALNYLLSARFVFDPQASGKSELRLLAEYAVSGLAGLMLTALVIALAMGAAGLAPPAAKAIAVVVTFFAVYLVRRNVVFAASARRAEAPAA